MDGTSPGNMPASLGGVWVGTTQCAPNPTWVTVAANNTACAPVSCIIDWPPAGPLPAFMPAAAPAVLPAHTHYHFAPPQRLSDEDVERIAKRVAELLREPR